MARQRYKVLLVDDEVDLLRLWRLRLESKGYEVAVAKSGEEALATFTTFKPEVVLTDLRMPGIDGFEMIRRLRADPQLQELDIVVVSGLADDEILENGGLPADVILYSKPVPFRELKGYVQAKIMAMQRRGRAL